MYSAAWPQACAYFVAFVPFSASGNLFLTRMFVHCYTRKTDWADGGDLKHSIRRARERQTPFSEATIWGIFAQVCCGIEYMHVKRIMHRDLKPANIFLMSDGTVRIGDLGLGRFFSDQTLAAYSKVGTPLYMSPEVLKAKGYDWKSDVWSLGCILYELAALRSPFKEQGLNLYGLFQKINKGVYPALDTTAFSPELLRLVDSMIQVSMATVLCVCICLYICVCYTYLNIYLVVLLYVLAFFNCFSIRALIFNYFALRAWVFNCFTIVLEHLIISLYVLQLCMLVLFRWRLREESNLTVCLLVSDVGNVLTLCE
jgi:serine/threonine protein kinase